MFIIKSKQYLKISVGLNSWRFFVKGIEKCCGYKIAGMNQIYWKFLKDGVRILAKLISELCNLSMTLGSFPDACKISTMQPLLKKTSKPIGKGAISTFFI